MNAPTASLVRLARRAAAAKVPSVVSKRAAPPAVSSLLTSSRSFSAQKKEEVPPEDYYDGHLMAGKFVGGGEGGRGEREQDTPSGGDALSSSQLPPSSRVQRINLKLLHSHRESTLLSLVFYLSCPPVQIISNTLTT